MRFAQRPRRGNDTDFSHLYERTTDVRGLPLTHTHTYIGFLIQSTRLRISLISRISKRGRMNCFIVRRGDSLSFIRRFRTKQWGALESNIVERRRHDLYVITT